MKLLPLALSLSLCTLISAQAPSSRNLTIPTTSSSLPASSAPLSSGSLLPSASASRSGNATLPPNATASGNLTSASANASAASSSGSSGSATSTSVKVTTTLAATTGPSGGDVPHPGQTQGGSGPNNPDDGYIASFGGLGMKGLVRQGMGMVAVGAVVGAAGVWVLL